MVEQNKDQIDAAVKQGQAMAESIDKEAIEMGVKEKLIAVSDAAKALAAEYTKKIEGGETIDVSADSILPVVATPAEGEEKKAEPTMKLDAASTPEQRLQTALYVSGNQKVRDDISARTCAEIKAELENNDKVPPAAKAKVEEQLPGLLVKALEQQIKAMAGKALKGEPLMSEEDVAKLAAYKEKKAAEKAEKEKAAAAEKAGAAAAPAEGAAAPAAEAAPVDAAQVKVEQKEAAAQ